MLNMANVCVLLCLILILLVKRVVSFKVSVAQKTAELFGKSVLRCNVTPSNFTIHYVEWYKGQALVLSGTTNINASGKYGLDISYGNRIVGGTFGKFSTYHDIVFNNSTASDEGTYKCRVKVMDSLVWKQGLGELTLVALPEGPPVVIDIHGNQMNTSDCNDTFNIPSTIVREEDFFICSVGGSKPPSSANWIYKGHYRLHSINFTTYYSRGIMVTRAKQQIDILLPLSSHYNSTLQCVASVPDPGSGSLKNISLCIRLVSGALAALSTTHRGSPDIFPIQLVLVLLFSVLLVAVICVAFFGTEMISRHDFAITCRQKMTRTCMLQEVSTMKYRLMQNGHKVAVWFIFMGLIISLYAHGISGKSFVKGESCKSHQAISVVFLLCSLPRLVLSVLVIIYGSFHNDPTSSQGSGFTDAAVCICGIAIYHMPKSATDTWTICTVWDKDKPTLAVLIFDIVLIILFWSGIIWSIIGENCTFRESYKLLISTLVIGSMLWVIASIWGTLCTAQNCKETTGDSTLGLVNIQQVGQRGQGQTNVQEDNNNSRSSLHDGRLLTFKDIVGNIYAYILSKLNPDTVIYDLQLKEVLNEAELRDILNIDEQLGKVVDHRMHRNYKLLQHLNNKGEGAYYTFLESLRQEGGQEKIVQMLEKEGGDLDMAVDCKTDPRNSQVEKNILQGLRRNIKDNISGENGGKPTPNPLLDEVSTEDITVTDSRIGSLIITFHCLTTDALNDLRRKYEQSILRQKLNECIIGDMLKISEGHVVNLEDSIGEEQFEQCRSKLIANARNKQIPFAKGSQAVKSMLHIRIKKAIIVKTRDIIINKIDLNHNLLTYLQERSMITPDTKRALEMVTDRRKRAEKLIQKILRLPEDNLADFPKALIRDGQTELADIILEKAQPMRYRTPTRKHVLRTNITD